MHGKRARMEQSGVENGTRKRARMEKSGEALKGSHEKENRDDRAGVDRPKVKAFSSLPRHLQELALLKTSIETRFKLFQVNRQLREWVFNEGFFPRDVERIETDYRTKRPREKILTSFSLRIFKIIPRSGLADIVEIDVDKAKASMTFKNVRSCRSLVLGCREYDFRIVDFFPNLRSLGSFDIGYRGLDQACFEGVFEGTTLEVTWAFNVPQEFLRAYHGGNFDEKKLFEWIDKYASRCPSINFAGIHFESTVEFLKTRKLRFIEYSTCANYSMYSMRSGQAIVEMIVKNGIPGEHPDPCIKIKVGPGLMIQVMNTLAKNSTLVIGDLERVLKKFMDHRAEVGWRLDNSVLESNAISFTVRFDESKNLIFLLFDNHDYGADLLIKYEAIEK